MIRKILVLGTALALIPSMIFADAVTPESSSGSIEEGSTVTIHKTVTISTTAPTQAKVDVMFLTDATASMRPMINSVKTAASSIIDNVAGLGDVQFAVGAYQDQNTPENASPYNEIFPFKMQSNLTSDTKEIQDAINSWYVVGNITVPESNLYALKQSADQVNWREGSTRIIVWFGDAPGFNPSADVTLNDAITALTSENIHVQAINTSTDPRSNLDYSLEFPSLRGQATAITTATDGKYYPSIDINATTSVITGAIKSVFDEYNTVSLEVAGNDNVSVSVSPSYTGTYDRAESRTFEFDLTLTGLTPGTDSYDVNVLVDGGIVATCHDEITVTSKNVPEPNTIYSLSFGLVVLMGLGIRRRVKL